MTNGTKIAMTVCGLLLAGGADLAYADTATKEAKVKCGGINACKGKGSCASAANACAGMNACKGKGWVLTTAKACRDQKGTIIADKPNSKPKR